MALISLTCPTCNGKKTFLLSDPPIEVKCIPCGGTGGVLVHSSSISGTRATRVIMDDPWSKVWERHDEFRTDTTEE